MTAAKTRAGSSRLTQWVTYGICVAIGAILFTVWAMPNWKRTVNGENDFLQLYAGAKLVRTPDLYNTEASRRIHTQVTSDGNWYPSVYYTRLPWYALALSPLGKLPYLTAYAIWVWGNIAIFAAFLYLYVRQYLDGIMFASLSVPMLVNFTNGQDAGLVTALCGFGMLLSARGRDFEAGLLMSLASIKFHVLILAPVAVILHRRWALLRGASVGAAVLLVLSAIADGWDWPRRFLAVVSNPELHPGPDHMVTLRNLAWVVSGGDNRPFELALSALVAVLYAWLAWRIRDFRIAFGLAIPAGLLVCHHAYSQDLLLLLLSLFLFVLARASSWLRGVTIVAVLPPAVFMLFSGFPYSTAVPLLLLSILLAAAAKDAHSTTGSPAGLQAS
ncbi:MAG: glycosyltransferase family 87 protein [Bryobacteraceae bacterium]